MPLTSYDAPRVQKPRADKCWSGHYWPNKMGLMMMLALEDVLSRSGINAVLNLAQLGHRVNNYPPDNLQLGFDFSELSMMMQF